jgi:hypothetical protein
MEFPLVIRSFSKSKVVSSVVVKIVPSSSRACIASLIACSFASPSNEETNCSIVTPSAGLPCRIRSHTYVKKIRSDYSNDYGEMIIPVMLFVVLMIMITEVMKRNRVFVHIAGLGSFLCQCLNLGGPLLGMRM